MVLGVSYLRVLAQRPTGCCSASSYDVYKVHEVLTHQLQDYYNDCDKSYCTFHAWLLTMDAVNRGRPWQYSVIPVIPGTPDFPTEYQIRRHSNPAGLPTFAAIWGPDFTFRASIIRLTCPHVFKQIKNRITLMTMFKVNRGPPN